MTRISVEAKYERNGWPSLARPDLAPPEGWSLALLAAVSRIHHHSLAPDGRHVAFVWDRDDLSEIYLLPTAGGWPARLTADRRSIPYWWDTAPQWSPDGQWLAFAANRHVQVVPAAGGLPRTISDFTSGASAPVWMPDSRGLIVVVERNDYSRLLLTDREGAWPRPIGHGPGDEEDAQPAPDGRSVAFVHSPRDDLNRYDIHLADLVSGTARGIVGEPGQKHWSPRWSPDGRWLACLSQRSGWREIWLVRPDGQELRQLTRLGHDISDIAWAPDGGRIACGVNRDGAVDLALIDVASGEPTYLRAGKGCYSRPAWSLDGGFLTVEYEAPALPPDLYLVPTAGGQATQLTFSNPPALARNALVTPERVRYHSYDGLEIPALLYRPPQPNGAAILYPHGGPRDQSFYDWDVLAQYFVAKGYTYLAPDYRGSTGHGAAFEHANQNDWGVGDAQDCLYGAEFLGGQPGIDRERIAIYGGSYGGYMVACCLARDPANRFACGVYKYGDAHLFTSWAQCERSTRLYTEMQMGHPTQNRAAYRAASPIFEAANIKKPVLILHGLDDDVCPPQSTEEWVAALRRADATFEYQTYPGEPHGFLKRENILDVYTRVEQFLDWYLM